MQKRSPLGLWLAVLLGIVLLAVIGSALFPVGGAQSIPYSRFLELIENGQVEKVAIGSEEVKGTYLEAGKDVDFVSKRPPGVDDA